MEIIIRRAEEMDIPAIHSLVLELAEYEKGLNRVSTTPESYTQDFKDGVFDAFVAEKEGEVVGMALYYMAFSTWRGRMMYLEDFVVRESERGKGIGALLFNAFLEESKRQKATMVKWQVLRWNKPAIRFYERHPTIFDDEWVDGKIYFI